MSELSDILSFFLLMLAFLYMITHFYETSSYERTCQMPTKSNPTVRKTSWREQCQSYSGRCARASRYSHFHVRSHQVAGEKKCNISRAVHPRGVSAWVQSCQGRGKLTATGAVDAHVRGRIYPAEVAVHVWPTGQIKGRLQ
jgi:hypothetical protein